jgi:hypothetical protein
VRTARLKRTEYVTVLDVTPDCILEVQRQDPVMSFLMERLQAGGPRPAGWDVQSGEEMRTYAAQYDSLALNNDLLCRRFIGDDGSFSHFQIIMPVSLRSQFIRFITRYSWKCSFRRKKDTGTRPSARILAWLDPRRRACLSSMHYLCIISTRKSTTSR